MAERWFLVPVERGTGNRSDYRFPAFVDADAGPPAIDTRPGGWSAMDMPGHDGFMLVRCPDIADVQAAALATRPGVYDFPADLTAALPAARRERIENTVIGPALGTDLDLTGMTGQQAIEEIMARLLQVQRFGGRHRGQGRRPLHPGPSEVGREMSKGEARRVVADRRRDALVDLGFASPLRRHHVRSARLFEHRADILHSRARALEGSAAWAEEYSTADEEQIARWREMAVTERRLGDEERAVAVDEWENAARAPEVD